MEISELTTTDENILHDLNRLLCQLSEDIQPLTPDKLQMIVNANHIHLFLAKDNEQVIGTLTLIENTLLSGNKAWIEDVVVDTNRRGENLGRKLVDYAIGFAKSLNIEKVDLTSRPTRTAANELYKKAGFELRDTNVYRYDPTKHAQ